MNAADREAEERVLRAARKTQGAGRERFGPSELARLLQEDETPLWMWEIRRALAALERSGDVDMDPLTATWSLSDRASAQTGARA